MVRHKLGIEHIISNVLSRLTSANRAGHDNLYSELDALFTYHTTLVGISPKLATQILDGYLSDDWWVKVRKQLLTNKNLGPDKVVLPFVFGLTKDPSSADQYFLPRPKAGDHASDFPTLEPTELMNSKIAQLIYHLDCVTGIRQLCISPSVTPDLIDIVHGEAHPGFACCHEIISRSWYIRGLTKILRSFIHHCP